MSFIKDLKRDTVDFLKILTKDIRDLAPVSSSTKSQRKRDNLEKDKEAYLWDYMPYNTFDLTNGTFLNKRGAGFIIKVTHFSGFSLQQLDKLDSFINFDIPSSCYLEIINYASPKVGYITEYWKKQANGKHLYEKLSKKRVDYINNGSWKNILGNLGGSYIFRDFELYFCVSINKMSELNTLLSFKDKIQYTLENLGSKVQLVNDIGLAIFLREFFYPEVTPHVECLNNRKDYIADYMPQDTVISVEKDCFHVEVKENKFTYLTFEITDLPEKWSISKSSNFMEDFEQGVKMPFPFLIRYGAKFQDPNYSKRKANKERTFRIVQNSGKASRFIPKMHEEERDWDEVVGALEKGQRLVKNSINIIAVISTETDKSFAAQAVKTHFSGLNFKIEQVKYETINTFIATLPFGFSYFYQNLEQIKITSTITSKIARDLMPVFADDCNNTSAPLMLLSGRRGQLYYFDNYASKENFNMVVVGKPGSGKSTFLNDFTTCTLRLGGQVITLDDGGSAKNNCLIQEGTHIDFGSKLCINPFSFYIPKGEIKDYVADFEEPFIELVKSILCIIAGVDTSKTSVENNLYQTIMRHAIVGVMKKKGKNGNFSDIQEELITNPYCRVDSDKDLTDRLIYVLETYVKGTERHYFNGQTTLAIDNMLTVFEFHKINSKQVIKNATLMMVTFLVYSKMFKRERRVALIIDEAWLLLQHDGIKLFMREIARKARKYKGCLVIATQNYHDFSPEFSETASEILPNCDWRLLLGADNSSDEYLKTLFSLNNFQLSLLKTVHAEKGLYSEYMICHKNGCSDIARLFLEPFSQGVYTSTAEDVLALEKYKDSGMTIEEAVDKLINQNKKYSL